MINPTIFALATPAGRSGVAVLRISGPHAASALEALGMIQLPVPRQALLASLRHPHTHAPIDQALVLWFPAPNSFTGEDIAELQVHGSRAVVSQLIEALSGLPGLRLAEAGEFSKRAFLNGKMDLTQAEGLADLIDAETAAQATQALNQMQGALGKAYEALRERIVTALAHMEAYIDFPDEDIPPAILSSIQADIRTIEAQISDILAQGRQGERIREGFSVVILGAPNSGKSSLINALAKREVAIVSHTAGTTRDIIEVHLNIQGLPVVIVDTAGIRESRDPIEQEGIRRALARAEHADIKLLLFDAAQAPDLQTMQLHDQQAILLASKSDSLSASQRGSVPTDMLAISAKTGDGLPALLDMLATKLSALASTTEPPLITRARHRQALEAALTHIRRFPTAREIELSCEELRLAALEIGKITGKIAVDELLDRVFREFCIGK